MIVSTLLNLTCPHLTEAGVAGDERGEGRDEGGWMTIMAKFGRVCQPIGPKFISLVTFESNNI